MRSIGIGELQKNISIFAHLDEAICIVDKRRKIDLAVVYPVKRGSVVDKMAGKYKDRIASTDLSMTEIRERAMEEAMREKYGLSD